LLHDPVAILSLALLAVVILGVFAGAPLAAHLLGHGPNDVFLHSVGDGLPAGPWTHVRNLDESYVHTDGTTLFVLGSDGYVGRDELLRLLYGGQTSLEVAVGARIIAMFLGTILGALGGYFAGWWTASCSAPSTSSWPSRSSWSPSRSEAAPAIGSPGSRSAACCSRG